MNPRVEIDRTLFPFTLPVFRNFEALPLHPSVTFFVGENASGKSTLLEGIATNFGFPAEGGTRSHHYSTFDSHSGLGDSLVLAKGQAPKDSFFFRSESFYNLATYLDTAAREGGGVPRFGWTHQRSHGEGFLETVSHLKPNGLYLFDEPESALSAQGQITFLSHMKRLVDGGSQFIIATHSPILMGFGKAWIYQFGTDGIARTTYRETEHYRLTFDFLRNRDRYAAHLGLDPEID